MKEEQGGVQSQDANRDLAAEQSYIDYAYECLVAMRRATAHLLETDAAANATARLALQELFLRRLEDLDSGSSLCFGRIDTTDAETFYIGRRHVHDAQLNPVVVDWRAPVAEAFYQASVDDAWNLERRRSFLTEGRRLLAIQEEIFAEPRTRSAEVAGNLVRAGDVLLADLSRVRTREMRDIVATIQKEQDRLIRAPANITLVVQGAPGTGKTAVGLHRAAFLLYNMRETLGRSGVLVVGPNRAFMRYIRRVLPGLGETTVVQKAIHELPAVRIRAEESDRVARLKGDSRMADVLRTAMLQRIRPPRSSVTLPVGSRQIRLAPAIVDRLIQQVVSHNLTYREGRDELASRLAQHVANVVGVDRLDVGDRTGEIVAALFRDGGMRPLLDRTWPPVSPSLLVRDLFGSATRLERATEGILDRDEQDLLLRMPTERISDERWTPGDAPLIDEAQALIAGIPRTYGHVVVDEAQDLSPMQLRMIGRRAPSGSITLLGDVAQATGVWGQTHWDDVLHYLPRISPVRVESLLLGYRVPANILRFASRLLPVIARELSPPKSIRTGGEPKFVPVRDRNLTQTLLREVEAKLSEQGSTGVIVPRSHVDEILGAARLNRIEFDTANHDFGRKATLLTAREAKGLEFDHVIVAEPLVFMSQGLDGYRELYVALTRATQSLTIVHSGALPRELEPQGRANQRRNRNPLLLGLQLDTGDSPSPRVD